MPKLPRVALLPLLALLVACGSAPGVTVAIGEQRIPTVLSSTSRLTAWGAGEVGDAFLRDIPLTTIHASPPVTLRLVSGPGATAIRGWLYDQGSPAADGGPLEQFTLAGGQGAYAPRSFAVGRTYEVMVNVAWSGLLVRGEETHVFRLRIEVP